MHLHRLQELDYGSLHSHRDYSDGVNTVERMTEYACELGHTASSINDHGTCAGLPHHWKVSNQHGVKPILGTEGYLRLNETLSEYETRNSSTGRFHITLWSSGLTGYNNLILLNNAAHRNIEQGRRKKFPIMTFDMFQNMDLEGIVVGSGCPASVTFHDHYEIAQLYMKSLINCFGKGNVYVELMEPVLTRRQDGTTFNCYDRPLQLAKEFDLQTIWTDDAHAAAPADLEALEYAMKDKKSKWGFDFTAAHLVSKEEIFQIAQERVGPDEAMRAMEGIHELINRIEEVDLHRQFELPPCVEEIKRTKKRILAAFERDLEKYKDSLGEDVMRERLRTEWDMNDNYKFWSYFAMVDDLVMFAHSNNISTTCRGSGGSSYLAYLMDVTQLNPIKHGFYFERFLCEKRFEKGELPDFDIDFASNRRYLVLEYARERWGMVGVGTLLTYSHKSLIRCIGRVWNNVRSYDMDPKVINDAAMYPAYELDAEGNHLGKTPTFETFCNHADFIEDMYNTMLNSISGVGTHACALAIVAGEILVPIEHFTNDPTIAYGESGASGKILQELGRVKIDALSIDALGLLDLMAEMAGASAPIEIEDGDPCFSLYNQGAIGGLFQVDTPVARRIVRDNAGFVNSIHDISRITASGRPGPMGQGLHEVTPANPIDMSHHPDFIQDILGKTNGGCIYQEQVMEIYASIAFDELNSDTLQEGVVALKAFVPKHKSVTTQDWYIELMDKLRHNFIEGGVDKHQLTDDYLLDFLDSLKGFARYGFNLPHSLLYANLSARMAWFKYNYPEVFWTVALNGTPNNKGNRDQVIRYFVEATRFGGVTIAAPTINTAETNYTLNMELKTVQMPLGKTIKGIGPKLADKIFQERETKGPFLSLKDFAERCSPSVTIKKLLYDCGVLDDIKTGDIGQDYLDLEVREFNKYKVRGKAWEDDDVIEINVFDVVYSEDNLTATISNGSQEWTIGGPNTSNKTIKGLKQGLTILAKVDGSHITKFTKKAYLEPIPNEYPRDKAIKDAYGFAWTDGIATFYDHADTDQDGLFFGFVCEIEEERPTKFTTQYSIRLESGRRLWLIRQDRSKRHWMTKQAMSACANFEYEYRDANNGEGLKAPYITPDKIPQLQLGDRIGGRTIQVPDKNTGELISYGQIMTIHRF